LWIFLFGEKRPAKKKLHQTNNPTYEEYKVSACACGLLTHGLLYLEFGDAIKGDGHRLLRCWRHFLMLFKEIKRTNYSFEVITMLVQYHFLLSPRA